MKVTAISTGVAIYLLAMACARAPESRPNPAVTIPFGERPEQDEPPPIASGDPSRGELDPLFGTAGVTRFAHAPGENRIAALTLYPDGSIAAAGHAPMDDGSAGPVALRLTENGQPDTRFGQRGVAHVGTSHGFGEAIAIDRRGRLLVAAYSYRQRDVDMLIGRLDASGRPDPSFGKAGTATFDFGDDDRPRAVLVSGARVLVVAQRTDFRCQVVALRDDGTLDTSFGNRGVTIFAPSSDGKAAFVTRALLATDGAIVAGGYLRDEGGWVTRLRRDGQLDPGFGNRGTVMLAPAMFSSAWGLGVDRRGRVLLGGQARNDDGVVARLLPDGRQDAAWAERGFASTRGRGGDQFYALLVDSTDNVIGAGFSNLAEDAKLFLVRFSARGALDRSFGDDAIVSRAFEPGGSFVFGAALDRAGRIVVGGEAWHGTQSRFLVARFR